MYVLGAQISLREGAIGGDKIWLVQITTAGDRSIGQKSQLTDCRSPGVAAVERGAGFACLL